MTAFLLEDDGKEIVEEVASGGGEGGKGGDWSLIFRKISSTSPGMKLDTTTEREKRGQGSAGQVWQIPAHSFSSLAIKLFAFIFFKRRMTSWLILTLDVRLNERDSGFSTDWIQEILAEGVCRRGATVSAAYGL